jgi:hypothetical protein
MPPRTYPAGFGRALADLAGKHQHPRPQPLEAVPLGVDAAALIALLRLLPEGEDAWPDAELESVAAYLLRNKHLETRAGHSAAGRLGTVVQLFLNVLVQALQTHARAQHAVCMLVALRAELRLRPISQPIGCSVPRDTANSASGTLADHQHAPTGLEFLMWPPRLLSAQALSAQKCRFGRTRNGPVIYP